MNKSLCFSMVRLNLGLLHISNKWQTPTEIIIAVELMMMVVSFLPINYHFSQK